MNKLILSFMNINAILQTGEESRKMRGYTLQNGLCLVINSTTVLNLVSNDCYDN